MATVMQWVFFSAFAVTTLLALVIVAVVVVIVVNKLLRGVFHLLERLDQRLDAQEKRLQEMDLRADNVERKLGRYVAGLKAMAAEAEDQSLGDIAELPRRRTPYQHLRIVPVL